MDDIRGLFNILLLSISLTTIIITLISFIIFKVRYNFKFKLKNETTPLTGQFFRRYAPQIEAKNNKTEKEAMDKDSKSMAPQKKLVISFCSLLVFIFGALSAENHFIFRKKLNERLTASKQIRELIGNGLLKKYDYDQTQKTASFKEEFPVSFTTDFTHRLNELKKQKIQLVLDPTNEKLKNKNHSESLSYWKGFFKRNKLKYELVSVYSISPGGIIIAPHLNYLSKKKREILSHIIKSEENAVLFIGNAGDYLTSNTPSQKNFYEEQNLFQIEKRDAQKRLSTQFIGFANFPAGLTIPLHITDNSFRVSQYSDKWKISSFYSSLAGLNTKENSHSANFLMMKNASLAWSHFSPIDFDDEQEKDNYKVRAWQKYVDYFFVSKLNELAHTPQVEIAQWKKFENKMAVSISVDAESYFERIEDILDLYIEHEIPATFFMVSSLARDYKNIIFSNFTENFEFVSHSLEHARFTGRDSRKNFLDLQESRFDIEELSHQAVKGYRPPYEAIDEEVLSAIVQNKFEYVLGHPSDERFFPYFVADGDIVYIPRIVTDDYNLKRDKTLASQSDIANKMWSEFQWVEQTHGLYSFNMHTHIFGEKFYLSAVDEFLGKLKKKDGVWIDKMGNLVQWYKNRSQIEAFIINQEGRPKIKLVNHSINTIRDFEINLQAIDQLTSQCQKRGMATKQDAPSIIYVEGLIKKSSKIIEICK